MRKLRDNTYITIKIAGDKELKELNKKYLKRDITTDVLSFNIESQNPDGSFHLGDIIINVEQAKRQAKDYNNDIEHEIAQLVEHGVLHLLGVHHPDDDNHSVHGVSGKA